MLYVLTWSIIAAVLAIWSFTVWALHSLANWTASNAGPLAGAASDLGPLQLPEWLAPWVPPEITQSVSALLSGLGPVVGKLLQAAPALAEAVTLASWVIWGLGSALLVVLGAGLHVLLALLRRRGGGRPVAPTAVHSPQAERTTAIVKQALAQR